MRTISRFPALLGALLALAAAVLGAAAPAATAAGWVLPAATLAPAVSGPGGAVAVDPGGDAVAAWTTADAGAGTQSLVVATRPAGGSWSAPQTLSDAGARDVAAPSVTIDGTGNATVLWIESADGSTYVARAARRDALSGSWSRSPDYPASRLTAVVDPETQVRADAAGDVIATWLEHDGAPPVEAVRAAVYSAATGTWSTAATLSDPTDASAADAPPQIAPDATGGPLVGWIAQRNADSSDQPVQTSTLSAGAWTSPTDAVTGDGNVRWPLRLVGADGGDVAAAWFETDATPATTLYGALRSGATWTVGTVSTDAPNACVPVPALGADGGGGATVAWEPQSSMGIDTVRLTSGGWGARVPVFPNSPTSTETASDPAVDHGTAVFVAHDPVSGTDSILASRRQDDGSWSRPADLLVAAPSGTSLGPTGVATDAAGDALASWTATDSVGTQAFSTAAFQAGGPQLSAVSVPGGVAGVPLSVSVSARSAFASVAQVAWDFGDGSALVAGTSASHTYASSGTYTVTITATDTLGDVTQTTRQVNVIQEPPPPPPSGGGSGGSGSGGGSSTPSALLRPRVGGLRGGVLILGRRSRTLKLLVRNVNRVRLIGGVSLVRPRHGRVRTLTLARIRTAALPAGRRVTLTLRLSDAALRALRGASGFRLPVVLTLRFRTADGRRVTVTVRATLDASARYGFGGRVRLPSAHAAC